MKYLKTSPELCSGCRACESACSLAFFKEDSKALSAIQVDDQKITVCNQCGVCAQMCPTQALSFNAQGVLTLNKTKCIGCLVCVAECPCGAMRFADGLRTPFKCIACGICTGKCPCQALEIVKE